MTFYYQNGPLALMLGRLIKERNSLILDIDLVDLVRREEGNKERPMNLRRIAKGQGWKVNIYKITGAFKPWGLVNLNAKILCSEPMLTRLRPRTLAEMGLKPVRFQELSELFRASKCGVSAPREESRNVTRNAF